MPMQAVAERPHGRVAVVGCGRWGRNLARCFRTLGVLEAIAESDIAHARVHAEAHGVRALTPEAAIHDPAVTAVVVATTPASHHALATVAIAAGRHVFVEKPLALDLAAATDIAERARTAGVVLMTGHILRYHPGFAALQALVGEGRLGRLLRLHATRHAPGVIRAEEDALWCLAPHDISMLLALMGELPAEVTASGDHLLRPDVADAASLRLAFASGAVGVVNVSWLHPIKEHRLAVVGEQAMAVFDDCAPWDRKLMLYPHRLVRDGATPRLDPAEGVAIELARDEPLLAECRHFLDCIATGATPLSGADEALAVMSVLQRAADAMVAGRPTPRLQEPAK